MKILRIGPGLFFAAVACGSSSDSREARDVTVDVAPSPTASATATTEVPATRSHASLWGTTPLVATVIATASASSRLQGLPLEPPIPECVAYVALLRSCPSLSLKPAVIAQVDDAFSRIPPRSRVAVADSCALALRQLLGMCGEK